MPTKLHATYYSSLPSVSLNSQPNINIEDCENQQNYNKYHSGYDRHNMTQGTGAGNPNDTTVNISQVNPMDNTYYTNHQARGDASFLNNNLNSSNYNTIGVPNAQHPSPTRVTSGTFMGYINAQ